MKSEYVLILHYLNGHEQPRWNTEVFCADPKDLAHYIEVHVDDLHHQLDDEYDHYAIERRVGNCREEYFYGSLEELIDAMKNQ